MNSPNNLRKSQRFHYTADTVDMIGRENEIVELKHFCELDNDMKPLPDQKPFKWWQITGEGGTGKSRLAYEFSKIMRRYSWTVCYPPNHTHDMLAKCSESLPNNTIFILDYSEYNTSDIFQWMSELQIEKYSDKKIRVLLIQRTGTTVQDMSSFQDHAKPDGRIKGSVYKEHFLRLPVLHEDNIKTIMLYYAKENPITPSDADELYNLLKKIDVDFLRPLYAIVLLEAFMQDRATVIKWSNKTDVLEYISEKECETIRNYLITACGDDLLFSSAISILIMATMTGGISKSAVESNLPKVWSKIHRELRYEENFFDIDYLFSDQKKFCLSLEPDIIGEYFVLF